MSILPSFPFRPVPHRSPLIPIARTAGAIALLCLRAASAQEPVKRAPHPESPALVELPEVVVTSESVSLSNPGPPPLQEKFQLPQTAESITAERIRETVNIVDPEDAVKYLPSLFVRKRNNGDTQATLATRTAGVNASARSLVYADDLLLSALIANNNTLGAPRWGLVSPEEIERVDFLYGPFAAAFPGNSAGGVLQITTRMPEKLVALVDQTEAYQTFHRYGTQDTYLTNQTNVVLGNKTGPVSWLFTGNYQESSSQPLAFVTNGTIPANTTGTFPALNKLGAPADVVGAGGLLHSSMFNAKGKIAWEVTPWLQAAYQVGVWSGDTESHVQTYLRDASGERTYAGLGGFANNDYTVYQTHLSNALSLKTDTKSAFDWDFSVSDYYYLEDIQRNPYGALPTGEAFTSQGKITRLDGTNWINGDFKGIWRPAGEEGPQQVTFGLHGDRYFLNNPVYATDTWTGGPADSALLYTDSRGVTTTEALWLQDAWRFTPQLKVTVGGRLEFWQASQGFNLGTTANSAGIITGTTKQRQPDLNATRFSPKASLTWTPAPGWEITGSFGQAYRFPTVTELYQIVSTGSTFAIPNPNLKPENVLSEELAIQRKFSDGIIRFSIFNENVRDALVSQTGFLAGSQTPTTFVTNVRSVRNTGVEFAAQKDHVLFPGLTLFGSFTYVDSEILSDPAWASATGSSVVGKRVPYVPDWRATFGATYHPTGKLALTVVGRYSGQQYSTLDNTDTVDHVFGAFDRFLVVDVRAEYKPNDRLCIDLGIDNINDEQYMLYHPFPGRTYTAEVKVQF